MATNSPSVKRNAGRNRKITKFALAGVACGSGSGSGPSPQPPGNTPGTPSASVEIAPAAGSEWYRKAVFYEVFVRSFQDSNGDGKGDLKGLLSRLDSRRSTPYVTM